MSQIRSSRSMLYRMALNAMLIALNAVMGLMPSEVSLQSLPVLVAACLLSPGDAVAVAVLGSFIEQLHYPLGLGSVLFLLPWLVYGLAIGFGARIIRRRERVWKIIALMVCAELLLNICNSTVLFSLGYAVLDLSSPRLFLLGFVLRMQYVPFRLFVYAVVVPLLLPPVRRALASVFPTSKK